MLQPNTLLQQRYQIIEQIGRGGMGAVYKATDTRLRSIVALKQTLVEGEPALRAFEREAQLLASLRHPNLPRVSDHFLEGDGQFLVMEFIPGDDLATLLSKRGTPFSTAEVLRWTNQLLDALEYLHSQQPPIIHRDIKPQNIKLTDRGEIILLDFGLAKGSNVQVTRVSTTGSIFGYTPHYAPLEQIQGSGTSERSDLYSVAATMHHLLSGSPPPDALTRAAAKINEEPDPLLPINQINPSVPAAVAVVFNSALSQRPDQRPASAAAMRAALQNASIATGRLAEPNNSAGLATIVEGVTIPPQNMVIVAGSQQQAYSQSASASQPIHPASVADHTTILHNQAAAAQPRDNRRWLWLGLLIVVLLIGAIGTVVALSTKSQIADKPDPNSIAMIIDASPAPTNTPEPTIDILVAAAGTQTAIAETQEALLATARVVLNATDFAATETAIALTPTMTPPSTAEPTAEPTDEPPPSNAPAAVGSPKPTPSPRPTAPPTNTPAAPNTPTPTSGPSGSVVSTGGGSMFRGTANLGEIPPEAGAGGTCIEGKVTMMDGGLFNSFGVQIDLRGNTRQATANFNTGTYRACGLSAGEWGISIFMAGGVNIPGPEQAAHQVRVLATGTPGEIFYVNFSALPGLVVPTPTPEPLISPYDGIWRGSNMGTTTTGEYPAGRFEIEVRNGLIYRISVDGPSCPFETYPNGARGAPINGNSFAIAGSVFHPITGENSSIQVQIQGTFSSTTSASGSLNAQQNGVSCAVAHWNASR